MRHTPFAISVLVQPAFAPGLELSGGPDAETIRGSDRDDRLFGGGGEDVFWGYGGNDLLSASDLTGNATLYGGAGQDLINIGIEGSLAFGGAGDDAIFLYSVRGPDARHTVFGGDGVDSVYYSIFESASLRIDLHREPAAGTLPTDRLFGVEEVVAGSGNDTIIGNTVANRMYGNYGRDRLLGGLGNDTLSGDHGDDTVFGGAGRDAVRGSFGADVLYGGDNNDLLQGDDGFDVLQGGRGSDTLYGGTSADRFVFDLTTDGGGYDRVLQFQVGLDKIVIDGVAGAGSEPVITITALSGGLQRVTVGDAADPVFEIGVRARGELLTESDIVFLFV